MCMYVYSQMPINDRKFKLCKPFHLRKKEKSFVFMEKTQRIFLTSKPLREGKTVFLKLYI